MPAVNLSVNGTERLVRLAAAIKQAGDPGLGRELNQAMQRAAKPLRRAARDGALQILPHRGGLDEAVAASSFSVQVRKTGDNAGIRVRGRKRGLQLDRMDRGMVRHPVFGHRGRWVWQNIRPGWFTKPMILESKNVRPELDKAMTDLARKLEAAGG